MNKGGDVPNDRGTVQALGSTITWPGQTSVQQWPYNYYYWPQPQPVYSDGQVQRFRGPVKNFGKLPGAKYQSNGEHAQVGDAYYVEDMKVLMIRTARGWLYVDDE